MTAKPGTFPAGFRIQDIETERLTALKVETEASTYAEVVKNALKLYASMVDLEKAGHEFLLKKSDGTVAPILLFKT